jgi:hypothetical protein
MPEWLWPFTVMQFNKRDHPSAAPIESLQQALNPRGLDTFEAVATRGVGVVEPVRALTSRILAILNAGSG